MRIVIALFALVLFSSGTAALPRNSVPKLPSQRRSYGDISRLAKASQRDGFAVRGGSYDTQGYGDYPDDGYAQEGYAPQAAVSGSQNKASLGDKVDGLDVIGRRPRDVVLGIAHLTP